MKILLNRIGRQAGGINRRVYEMCQYADLHQNHELVVVGMGENTDLAIEKNGPVKTYWLPASQWQMIDPGGEKVGIPNHLESIENFRGYVSGTVEQIDKVIAKENPDVCFVQGAFYFPWCLTIAASTTNTPIVQLYCGSTQTEVLNPALKQAYRRLEKGFSKLSALTLFNSKIGRSFIERTFARDYSDSPVIYNGFPVEYAEISSIRPHQIVIGWVGRDAVVKNIDYLLRLRDYLPREEYPIFAVTSMNQQDLKMADLNNAGITIFGQVSPERMLEFYKNISCVLSTSYFEFFPNVIAEAIAATRIPIVPSESGIAELLVEHDLGELVYQIGEPEELARLIRRSNDFLGKVNGVSGRLLRDYSWERVIERYFLQFERVIR